MVLTGEPETALPVLEQSIAIARAQGAWLLALHAAIDLARICAARRNREEAARRLSDALGDLPARPRTADRSVAEDLLRELS